MEGIEVYDMLGNLVYAENAIKSRETTISTATLPQGVYMLKAILKNGEYTGRFVKE